MSESFNKNDFLILFYLMGEKLISNEGGGGPEISFWEEGGRQLTNKKL